MVPKIEYPKYQTYPISDNAEYETGWLAGLHLVVNSNRWAVVTQDAASLVDAVRDGVRDGVWESVAVRVTVADSVAVLVGDEVLVSDRRRVGPQPLIGLKVIFDKHHIPLNFLSSSVVGVSVCV